MITFQKKVYPDPSPIAQFFGLLVFGPPLLFMAWLMPGAPGGFRKHQEKRT